MASRTGLLPVKADKKPSAAISAKKPLQSGKLAPPVKTGVRNVKTTTIGAKPFFPHKHAFASKTTVTSNVSKKVVLPVANKASHKPVLAAKSKNHMRNSHAGFTAVERGLQKHTTPVRKSFVPGQRTPKSILKREPVVPDTDKKPASVVPCPDSHHVKFKSKATEQARLREKLNAWLESKGKNQSASNYRHLMCFDKEMSAKKKSEVLVDRTLTHNVLSQQMKVLNNEAVKKKLFKVERRSFPHIDKENSAQDNKNDNAATIKEAGGGETEENGGYTEEKGVNSLLAQDGSSCGNVIAADLLNKIQVVLDECLHLFNSGCPLENVLPWFTELEVNMPEALRLSTYYVYKAKIVAAFPRMVLDVYCEAVKNNAQPYELLATEMKSSFSKWLLPVNDNKTQVFGEQVQSEHAEQNDHDKESLDSIETLQSTVSTSSCRTPKEAGDRRKTTVHNLGSTVKYSIGSAKPLVIENMGHSGVAFVTPVRRSIRLSGKPQTPSSGLRREVNSVSDLSSVERQSMLYKINPAITGK